MHFTSKPPLFSQENTESVKRTTMFHSYPITAALIEFRTQGGSKLALQKNEVPRKALIYCVALHRHSKM